MLAATALVGGLELEEVDQEPGASWAFPILSDCLCPIELEQLQQWQSWISPQSEGNLHLGLGGTRA